MGEMRVEEPALLNATRRTITLKRISQTKQTVKEKLPAHNAKFSLDLLVSLIFQQIITACSSTRIVFQVKKQSKQEVTAEKCIRRIVLVREIDALVSRIVMDGDRLECRVKAENSILSISSLISERLSCRHSHNPATRVIFMIEGAAVNRECSAQR